MQFLLHSFSPVVVSVEVSVGLFISGAMDDVYFVVTLFVDVECTVFENSVVFWSIDVENFNVSNISVDSDKIVLDRAGDSKALV